MDHPPTALAPMPGPSAQSNSLGLQQAPGQEDKKGKYDDLKKTVRFFLSQIPSSTQLTDILDGSFGCWWCRFWCWSVPCLARNT